MCLISFLRVNIIYFGMCHRLVFFFFLLFSVNIPYVRFRSSSSAVWIYSSFLSFYTKHNMNYRYVVDSN